MNPLADSRLLSPRQAIFLWRLILAPEGFFLDEVKSPSLKPAERDYLVNARLIEIEKRKKPVKGSRGSLYATLTEAGWRWIETNIDAPLPASGNTFPLLVKQMLRSLRSRLDSGDLTLASLFAPPLASSETRQSTPTATAFDAAPDQPLPSEPPTAVPTPLRHRLLEACHDLSGDGVYGVRIRLADLRSKLADVSKTDVDRALYDLEHAQVAALLPLDDPREIAPSDEAAAIANSLGTPRHVLYLSRPR